MTIYIDTDFKCHVTEAAGRRAIETDRLDGLCDEAIEGYRFIPAGEVWTREDGEIFSGEMIAPWKNSDEIYRVQLEYEAAEMKAALALLGVEG